MEIAHCRAGKRCTGGSSEGPAETVAPLCSGCIQDIIKCLSDLPHLARVLRYFVRNKPRRGDGPKITRTPEPPCLLDTGVDALLTEVYAVVDRAGGWKVRIADLAVEPGMEFLVWVSGHQEVRMLEGWRRCLDIRRVHSRVNDVAGLEKTRVRRHAPCMSCGLSGVLWSWVGEDTVRCDACPELLTTIQYNAHCAELLRKR